MPTMTKASTPCLAPSVGAALCEVEVVVEAAPTCAATKVPYRRISMQNWYKRMGAEELRNQDPKTDRHATPEAAPKLRELNLRSRNSVWKIGLPSAPTSQSAW